MAARVPSHASDPASVHLAIRRYPNPQPSPQITTLQSTSRIPAIARPRIFYWSREAIRSADLTIPSPF
jgi:hypothetical protein